MQHGDVVCGPGSSLYTRSCMGHCLRQGGWAGQLSLRHRSDAGR